MSTQSTSSPTLVNSARSYAQLLAQLAQQRTIALDTESDSLYSYYPKVCLIQISVPAGSPSEDPLAVEDYLVDPLRLTDLSALGERLSAPGVEVVMHAAENDMLLLHRNFSFTFACVFDTQLAARILGWPQVGLAAILEEQFGILSDKRMQRTNWGKRPLTPEQIAYAQMDTHYLLALRQRLIGELASRARWDEAQEAFEHLARVDYAARRTEERTFWQMKAVREVPLAQLGMLEALWQWREQEARRQNRPPFKVVNDAVLIVLAQQPAATHADLLRVEGLSEQQVQRYGTALLHAIEEGRQRPQPPLPNGELRPETLLDKPALARYDALRKWRSETASQRGVNPDIVLTNSTLLAIAQQRPRTLEELAVTADLGPWKLKSYGASILGILKR